MYLFQYRSNQQYSNLVTIYLSVPSCRILTNENKFQYHSNFYKCVFVKASRNLHPKTPRLMIQIFPAERLENNSDRIEYIYGMDRRIVIRNIAAFSQDNLVHLETVLINTNYIISRHY